MRTRRMLAVPIGAALTMAATVFGSFGGAAPAGAAVPCSTVTNSIFSVVKLGAPAGPVFAEVAVELSKLVVPAEIGPLADLGLSEVLVGDKDLVTGYTTSRVGIAEYVQIFEGIGLCSGSPL